MREGVPEMTKRYNEKTIERTKKLNCTYNGYQLLPNQELSVLLSLLSHPEAGDGNTSTRAVLTVVLRTVLQLGTHDIPLAPSRLEMQTPFLFQVFE
jgi:hypothetical protein